jgi:predicted outer membrane repeat protein
LLLIEDCVFKDCRNAFGDGGAMYVGTKMAVIRNCSFLRNRSTVHGAAIYTNDGTPLIVEHCIFQDHTFGTGTFYSRIDAHMIVRDCVIRNSNWLCAHFQTGTVTFTNNIGCSIGALSNGGYVDGGNNNWAGPCPDCDSNGKLDLEEILFGGADCNGNDLLDACEVVDNPKLDGNGDGLIDECQCLADVTGNGSVDAIDLAALMSGWGSDGSGEFDADVTNDGVVNGLDLAVILDGWGACPN